MNLQDLSNWVPVSKVPMLTNGCVTITMAKRTFRDRERNGLATVGAAVLIGKTAFVNLPRFLDHIFSQNDQAA